MQIQPSSPTHGESALPDEVRALLAERFQIKRPLPQTDLIESGLLDSLQLVDFLELLQERYGLRVPVGDIDLEQLRTVEGIAGLLGPARH